MCMRDLMILLRQQILVKMSVFCEIILGAAKESVSEEDKRYAVASYDSTFSNTFAQLKSLRIPCPSRNGNSQAAMRKGGKVKVDEKLVLGCKLR